MNFYIAFFLPCILGLLVYYIFTKEKKHFDLGIMYLVNVLLTNMCSIGIMFFKDKLDYSLVTRLEGDFRFAFKYMLLGTVVSVVIAIVSVIVKKYFSVSVEVKNGRKK